MPNPDSDDTQSFQLHDLRVDMLCDSPPGGPEKENQRILCGAKPGDHFELRGEMMYLPPGQGVSIYSLAAVLPLLPAKQRPTLHPHDWMFSDAEVACPDPLCPSRMRITRGELRTFMRGEVTGTPVPVLGGNADADGGEGGDGGGDGGEGAHEDAGAGGDGGGDGDEDRVSEHQGVDVDTAQIQ